MNKRTPLKSGEDEIEVDVEVYPSTSSPLPPALDSPLKTLSESPNPTNPSILMQGWVVKEDSKQSHLYKPWTKRFLVLEKETKMLKYAASQAVIGFPSQVKGIVEVTCQTVCAPGKVCRSIW